MGRLRSLDLESLRKRTKVSKLLFQIHQSLFLRRFQCLVWQQDMGKDLLRRYYIKMGMQTIAYRCGSTSYVMIVRTPNNSIVNSDSDNDLREIYGITCVG